MRCAWRAAGSTETQSSAGNEEVYRGGKAGAGRSGGSTCGFIDGGGGEALGERGGGGTNGFGAGLLPVAVGHCGAASHVKAEKLRRAVAPIRAARIIFDSRLRFFFVFPTTSPR